MGQRNYNSQVLSLFLVSTDCWLHLRVVLLELGLSASQHVSMLAYGNPVGWGWSEQGQ